VARFVNIQNKYTVCTVYLYHKWRHLHCLHVVSEWSYIWTSKATREPKFDMCSFRNINQILTFLLTNIMHKYFFFIISILYASIYFNYYVLIIRSSNLYYTASGINTLCRWLSVAQVPTGEQPTGVIISDAV